MARTIEVVVPGGFRHGTDHFKEGEVRILDDEAWAAEFIRLGWARDPVTGEQGELKPGAQTLQVQDSVQAMTGG